MDHTLPNGIYHENGWFEIRDLDAEGAWLATDSPAPLLP
jgi:hypothetical protein